MGKLLLSTAFILAFSAPVAAQSLNVDVFDNGVLVGSDTSSSGNVNLDVSDPNFDILSVTAAGVPDLTGADLSSVTLNVTSGAIVTTHNLEIDIFQTGVSAPSGTVASSFTSNSLVGTPGPTTTSTFINGTSSTLGTLVESVTFPAGTVDGSAGPLFDSEGPLTASAQQYLIAFTAPDQSENATIQFGTAVPEASTWAMLVAGFLMLGWFGRRRSIMHLG